MLVKTKEKCEFLGLVVLIWSCSENQTQNLAKEKSEMNRSVILEENIEKQFRQGMLEFVDKKFVLQEEANPQLCKKETWASFLLRQ